MRKINLKSVVWKEGKYYVSQCLEVEVSSFGKTRKQASDNFQEALELYFEDVSLPERIEVKNTVITSVQLQYA